MRLRQKKDSGMTILEILVVIAILGIFMGIAIPSVSKSFRTIDQVKQLTVRYPNARKALERMSDMVRQTYPAALASGASFVGHSGFYEAGGMIFPSDKLSFPVLDTKYAHVRSLQEISYRLELGPEKKDSPRGLVERRSFLGGSSGTGLTQTMPGKIAGLDFQYLDDSHDAPQWIEEWPASFPGKIEQPVETSNAAETVHETGAGAGAPQSTRLPKAVKITIIVLGDISPKPTSFTTVVNVPSR